MSNKKGILYRITMGKDDQKDFEPSSLATTRRAQFKDILAHRLGMLMKLNVLTMIFCLPAILWIIYMSIAKSQYGYVLPYNGNVGLGLNVTNNIKELGSSIYFAIDIRQYAVLVPLIMVASIGLAGMFYCLKKVAFGEEISVFTTYFRGIKRNILQFLVIGVFIGAALFVLMYNITGYNNLDIPVALQVIGIVVTVLLFVITLFALIFFTTQAVTYKISIPKLIANSYIFAIAMLPLNIAITIVALAPTALIFAIGLAVPSLYTLFYFALLAISISFAALVFTLYAHYVYDRFVNDRIQGAKNKGLYVASEDVENSTRDKKQKVKAVAYQNPKKKSAKVSNYNSVEQYDTEDDEDIEIDPLMASFDRRNILALEAQKNNADNNSSNIVVDECDIDEDDID